MAARLARHLVSQNKKRFTQDGFDLDLVYLTDEIICMGLPAEGKEAFYRNPIDVLVRFFESRHAGPPPAAAASCCRRCCRRARRRRLTAAAAAAQARTRSSTCATSAPTTSRSSATRAPPSPSKTTVR